MRHSTYSTLHLSPHSTHASPHGTNSPLACAFLLLFPLLLPCSSFPPSASPFSFCPRPRFSGCLRCTVVYSVFRHYLYLFGFNINAFTQCCHMCSLYVFIGRFLCRPSGIYFFLPRAFLRTCLCLCIFSGRHSPGHPRSALGLYSLSWAFEGAYRAIAPPV
jgi:hypothetical protein